VSECQQPNQPLGHGYARTDTLASGKWPLRLPSTSRIRYFPSQPGVIRGQIQLQTGLSGQGERYHMTISEVIKKQSTKQLTRAGFAALVFAVTIAAYLLGKSISNTSSIINDVFLGLAAAMGVHLLDRIWLHKDTETAFEQLQTSIIKNASDTSLGTARRSWTRRWRALPKAFTRWRL
jgi:hypothetical protein